MKHKVSTSYFKGYKTWVSPETYPLKKIIFGLLSLEENKIFEWESDSQETVMILLSGKASVESNNQVINIGPRGSVFHDKASAVWIPPKNSVNISTDFGQAFFAVCQSPMAPTDDLKPIVVHPNQVIVNKRGKSNWYREVHDIIDSRIPSKSLVIGETFNFPGNWSSYPPHKHEIDDYPYEVCLEEVYFYQLNPTYGFGLQRLYSDDSSLDKALVIKNGDIIIINHGYHPVVVAPGISLYYLWVLAGDHRFLVPKDDPNFSWIQQFAKMM